MFRRSQEREASKSGGRVRSVAFTAPYLVDECRVRLKQVGALRNTLEMPGGLWIDADTSRMRSEEGRALRLVRFEGYLLPDGTDTHVTGKIVPRSLHETIPLMVMIGLMLWLVPMLSDELTDVAAVAWTLVWGGALGALGLLYRRYRQRRQAQLEGLERWLHTVMTARDPGAK